MTFSYPLVFLHTAIQFYDGILSFLDFDCCVFLSIIAPSASSDFCYVILFFSEFIHTFPFPAGGGKSECWSPTKSRTRRRPNSYCSTGRRAPWRTSVPSPSTP